jgi:hypothetical protein
MKDLPARFTAPLDVPRSPGARLIEAFSVEERIICDFERINSDPLSGLLAKRGAAFRSF